VYLQFTVIAFKPLSVISDQKTLRCLSSTSGSVIDWHQQTMSANYIIRVSLQ